MQMYVPSTRTMFVVPYRRCLLLKKRDPRNNPYQEMAARNCGSFQRVILEILRPNIETFSDRLVQLEEIMGATEGKNHLPQKTTCTVLYHV